MTTWLDVGNAWRNLFLLSCLVQAAALGTFFAVHRLWVKKNRLGAFLAGVSITPLCQYLWMLLLAAVWANAPRFVYIGVPPLLAGLYLLWALFVRLMKLKALLLQGWCRLRSVCRFDHAALVSLCFVLALAILLAPICVRTATSTTTAQADSGEYMALALRYCEDRSLTELMDKDDQTGHFRGNAHFPSLELYMAYGLMHTSEVCGYPYDKPMHTGLGLLVFYLLAAFGALLIQVCNGRRRWVLLGLMLFNLVPNYVYSLLGAPRDSWRCLGILAAAVALLELRPNGNWKRLVGKIVGMLALCFTVMSTHVVSFVVLPFMVVAWVLMCWMEALLTGMRQAGKTLARSVGVALGGAVGTLAAYAGNLWCYAKWGEMSPWRLMTTYTSAPWFSAYMQGEYKLEETTTHLDFWKAKYDIVMAYATPVGIWGLRLALAVLALLAVVLIARRIKLHRSARLLKTRLRQGATVPDTLIEGTAAKLKSSEGKAVYCVQTSRAMADRLERLMPPVGMMLMLLLTLAPMSGLLDTRLYSFSGSFLTMQRYTLQWFMLACAMIAATLSFAESAWPLAVATVRHALGRGGRWMKRTSAKRILRAIPAWLCAVLCVLSFVQGTRESGYANSFYRYGRPVLSDDFYAQDNSFTQRYELLLQLDDAVLDNQKVVVTRAGYQYALHAKGYVLTSNPIVPLMNAALDEVPQMLDDMNVAALCTEPDFWDERYFAQSALSDYLNALPAEQIVDDGNMRVYLIDPTLVGSVRVNEGA